MENTLRHNLAWFTNTTIYKAWLSPPPGEVVSSRFLWYPTKDHLNFGQVFSALKRQEGIDVLYFDCAQDLEPLLLSIKASSRYPIITSSTTSLIMWSLVSQALHGRRVSDKQFKSCILEYIKLDFCALGDTEKETRSFLDTLGSLLRCSLNLKPTREVVIVMDHVDKLNGSDLIWLREVLQDVLDSQRSEFVAQTRAMIVGKVTGDVLFTFQGTAKVDEDTEYYGNTLIIILMADR